MKKRINLAAIPLLICLLLPNYSLASEIAIRPFLVDETLEPRDSITKTISLTSDYDTRKAVMFVTVNEITIDSAGEIKEFVSPVMTDRTNTITSWLEITRGRVELMPKESVEVPLTIKVHPYAEPGVYHAFIGFVEAPNRPKAESVAMAGDAKGVIVKVTIADERKDSMRISSFIINRFVTGDNNRSIDIEVENMGDLPSSPAGEIIFYDSKGVEVTSVPVDYGGKAIAPGEKVVLKSSVPLDNDLGRFKANISLDYGENQRASLYDTTFFYMMPMNLMIIIFIGILLTAVIVALLFRRAFAQDAYDDEDGDEVVMYVKDGHDAKPQDHDIDLKNK